jgi:hypothetical protein
MESRFGTRWKVFEAAMKVPEMVSKVGNVLSAGRSLAPALDSGLL